jgi:hypothetical protein
MNAYDYVPVPVEHTKKRIDGGLRNMTEERCVD